jgi:hypothetical protein
MYCRKYKSRLSADDHAMMAPYADMAQDTIAFTAWARRDKFSVSQYSASRADNFIRTFSCRFDPERVCNARTGSAPSPDFGVTLPAVGTPQAEITVELKHYAAPPPFTIGPSRHYAARSGPREVMEQTDRKVR